MEDDIDKLLRKIKAIVIKYKVIVICMVILISIITIYRYIKNDNDIINISNVYKDKETNKEEEEIDNEKDKKKIVVHIDGQVINKGVYTIDSEYRLNDLVNLAGGLTNEADISKINLAKKLTDGEKIYIYAIGESVKTNQESENLNSEASGKININTASKNELKTLPGIGDATADKIIQYRDNNGEFVDIQDIQKVNGIGESKYKNIEDLICI